MSAPGPAAHKRPTGWIVLIGLLAVGLLALAVYAIGLNSDLDDANATIATQKGQLAQSRKNSDAPLASANSAFAELRKQLGGASVDQAAANQHLDEAVRRAADTAKTALKQTDAATKAQAQVDAARATAQAAKACADSVVGAVGGVFEGTSLQAGAQAAAAQLEALKPQCAAALAE